MSRVACRLRLPKPHVKGADAEAGAVACALLAAQIISVLLSQKCGVLSYSTNKAYFICYFSEGSSILFAAISFLFQGELQMKNTIFTGAATAIVTPLNEKGIDFDAFHKLIEWQIAEGIDAIVVAGTTGEGSTLTDEEHKAVIKFCVDKVAGRVPVIAGTGSNDIAYAISLTEYACEVGADAMLLVTPYYNKATQNGLIKSFTAVADASSKPCILYNVPSRTGCNLKPETCAALAKHPNIVAIKEASGDISQVAAISRLCGDSLDIYSGNDDQIVPVMSLGGKGVISVLSNLLPKETSQMCHAYLDGDCKTALDMQLKYLPVIDSLFCEVNPIPVKAAMSAMGYCDNYLRLPLTSMEEANEKRLLNDMRNAGIKF